MTIRRQWLLVLIITAIIAVSVNSLVLSSLINTYFDNYATDEYTKHSEQIVEFSKDALSEKNYSAKQLTNQLEAHLSDPIIRIQLYDINGNLLADVSSGESEETKGMMRNKLMNTLMGTPIEEKDEVTLTEDGVTLGKLTITRYSSIANSIGIRKFRIASMTSSFLSIGVVLIFIIIVGGFISRRMGKDMTETASLAVSIDLGNEKDIKLSKVREIRMIQQSLQTLKSKLKLKQTSRKNLVDELVHQTRTPLTILKTHLEAFEDGIVKMTPDEIKICEDQIENITAIIANMSRMLDAEKEEESLKIEEFEVNQLLKQIMSGLKVQFEKKQISLSLLSNQKVALSTDKYKLSQSIYNILVNAYKFTEKNGKVSISYEASDEELTITFEDTGIGISEEDVKHLFDAYYRGNNTSEIPGEGIGLYIVKENISKIFGYIDVVSQLGVGSKFIIKIPRKI